MEAGLDLFGTIGYARTSVRAVSAAASLNSRYFYESFSSREDLLYAVYQRIVTDIFTRAAAATARETTLEAQARATCGPPGRPPPRTGARHGSWRSRSSA